MTESSHPHDATDLPKLAALITTGQTHARLTDDELAQRIGYDSGRVIAMVKSGAMRLPINKVAPIAHALGFDAVLVFRAVLNEHNPELLSVIEDILEPLHLTREERRMICHLREVCGEREVKPLVFDGQCVVAFLASGVK